MELPSAGRARGYRARLAARVLLAATSGLALYASFAPRPLWWLAPLAFTGLGLALQGRRFRAGLGYGFVFGVAFFGPLLAWLQHFLGPDFGPWPWLAVSALMSLYLALAGGLVTLAARLPGAPVWMALVVVALEIPRAWFPLGGFPWGRVAFSQPEGVFTSLASLGGEPLVGFAVVLCGFGLARLLLIYLELWSIRQETPCGGPCLRPIDPGGDPAAATTPRKLGAAPSTGWRMAQLLGVHHGGWRPRRALLAPGLAAVVPIAAGLAVWPSLGTDAQAGSLTVAVVQGNAPDVGLALLREGQVLRRNHVAESERLLADVRAGRAPQPDLVVWPETAGVHGEDPRVDQLVDDFGVPALIGALERGPDGHTRNVVIAWEPGTGAGERYVKQQLVPFGEYLPAPSIARLVTPFTDDSDTVVAGSGRPAALTTAGTTVGTFISYEAAYDYPAREAVRAGAQLLVNPTNHAWYGRGEASHQQLAMTRLRAVKHGRAVVVAATSGVSAIIAPDGSLRQATGLFTPASLVARVPLRQEVTVATRLGTWTETALVAIALAASARRRVPGTPNPEEDMR